jgi:hypothetical protein
MTTTSGCAACQLQGLAGTCAPQGTDSSATCECSSWFQDKRLRPDGSTYCRDVLASVKFYAVVGGGLAVAALGAIAIRRRRRR